MTATPFPLLPTVLDPRQLDRIEAVHRGLLYQHLYLVGCLLVAQRAGVRVVLVERDEDVELRADGAHVYIQVKTRRRALQPSDVSGALERFADLRAAHTPGVAAESSNPISANSGTRHGAARFLIVSSAAPGPDLEKALSAADWPADVVLLWPGHGPARVPELAADLPPAWGSVHEAVGWCVEQAKAVPYTRMAPATLVWKLAALAQAAAMGGAAGVTEPHAFTIDALPELFEQIVQTLQALPEPPSPYWPVEGEPTFASDAAVRLIIGPSGAGKSAWAAAHGPHAPDPVAYFAASVGAGSTFAAALVQELVARFVPDGADRATVLMPGASGFDALRALALALEQRGLRPLVVLDDVQRLAADEVREVVRCAPNFRWILLSHPGSAVPRLEALLGVTAEPLSGWPLETVAAALRAAGGAADAPTCQRVRSLTAGLPLFVRNLAQLAAERHGGDVAELCDALERGAHLQPTAQEALLESTVAALSPVARQIAELLALARVPLDSDEAITVAEAAGIGQTIAGRALRDLFAWGVARHPRAGEVQLHDAFRLLCDGSSGLLTPDAVRRALQRLVDVLDPARRFSLERAGRFLELLAAAGQTERLVEIVGNQSEELYELGLAGHVTAVLRALADDDATDPDARFWVLDALAYWDLQTGRTDDARPRVTTMARLVGAHPLGSRATAALLTKRVHLAVAERDLGTARRTTDELLALCEADGDKVAHRVARYNFAVALHCVGRFADAANAAWLLGLEYYDVLDLDPIDVFRRNAPEVAAMLPEEPGVDAEVKRLADSLDLYARAQAACDEPYGLALIHAFKFYTICGAYQSAVKTGQNLVDDLLHIGDPEGARGVLETTILPSLTGLSLIEHLVPVRAQYAVVLAHCGATAAARREIVSLRAFAPTSAERLAELESAAQLVEEIAAGRVRIQRAPAPRAVPEPARPLGASRPGRASAKVGRNDPCPCGSGDKYKKCHGRPS